MTMTPKERFLKRMKGESVDKIPNFNIVMEWAAKYVNQPMDKFCSDYRVLVDGNIKTAEDFGIDILNTMSDPTRETADYGADIVWKDDKIPLPNDHNPFIQTAADVKKLKPINIYDSVRMLDRLRAVELYKKEMGDKYPIMGWVEGTVAEAGDLMGLTSLLMTFYDDPAMIREMMDIHLESAKACIKAQVDAGADIIGVGDAACSIIGPDLYREFGLPYEKQIFAYIKECGAFGRLHICGNTEPILDDIAQCGADIVDVDWMVDFKLANEKLVNMSACGNFDPVSVILQGTPDSIANEAQKCVDAGNNLSIIMAGCEIPPNTSKENLLAVHTQLLKAN